MAFKASDRNGNCRALKKSMLLEKISDKSGTGSSKSKMFILLRINSERAHQQSAYGVKSRLLEQQSRQTDWPTILFYCFLFLYVDWKMNRLL
eukprot:IDg4897t1